MKILMDLTDANLTRANLTGANLTGADLTGADLTGADLTGADLTGANLTGANLTVADLTGANLTGANLTDANLTGANLTDANLTDANLTDANLTGANLTGANLARANLTEIKDDFFAVLVRAIPEVEYLKEAVINGKINGSTYDVSDCSCLSGTLEFAATEMRLPTEEILLCRRSNRPIERFFLSIRVGDNPGNSQFSLLVLRWIEEFQFLINNK
jgi:uncharacterized protein YjbI with pentapeptide repeats